MVSRKILLVDDVEFFLELEREFLGQAAAEILTAKNGQEALSVAARERPGLIFMDVQMPIMDGLACCRALKADNVLREIPVVIVFAPSHEITSEVCRQSGCDAVLTKPLDRKAFLDLGRSFLFHIDRREPRVPCRASVTVSRIGSEAIGSGEDISQQGMYVACRQEVQPHEVVRLSIRFADSSLPIEVRGRVAWVNQGSPRPKLFLPRGFGIEFVNPDPLASAVIRDVVRKGGGVRS